MIVKFPSLLLQILFFDDLTQRLQFLVKPSIVPPNGCLGTRWVGDYRESSTRNDLDNAILRTSRICQIGVMC
jgi:hypothetical protein